MTFSETKYKSDLLEKWSISSKQGCLPVLKGFAEIVKKYILSIVKNSSKSSLKGRSLLQSPGLETVIELCTIKSKVKGPKSGFVEL